MSNSRIEMVPQIIIEPKDAKTCTHHWSYHTYWIGGLVTTKKLCFYCKSVEPA